jgi:hypothetical protein
MEDKYKQFLNYDWNGSEAWKNYLENDLYPKPNTEELIFHFKKRFYKSRIDPEFDEKYTSDLPSKATKTTKKESSDHHNKTFCSHHSHIHNHQNPNVENKHRSIIDNVMSSIEAVLWVSYFMNIVIRSELLKLIFLALCSRIFVTYKNSFSSEFFTLNKESLNKILKEPNIQLILYTFILSFATNLNYLFLFPISITAILSICDYFVNFLRIFQFTKKYFQYVIDKSDYLNKLKSFSFVLIGFLTIIGFIIRWYGIIFSFGYLFYLRILYKNNSDVGVSFRNIKRWITSKTSHAKCPKFIQISLEKIINLIEKMS